MPRRSYKKRPVETDPVFNSIEVEKLTTYLMIDGKKTIAQKTVYDVLKRFEKEGKEGLQVLLDAVRHVSPTYEVKPRRLGGASYLVPTEVRSERKLFLSLNWIIEAARARSNKEFHSFADKLYIELKEAAENQGPAVAKKLQTEKLADANKAFAHLKW